MTIAGGKPERINQGRKSLFQFMVARLCGSYGGQNSVVIGGYLIIVASNPEEWEMKGPGVLRSLWFWLSPARPLWLRLQPTPSGSASSPPPLALACILHIFMKYVPITVVFLHPPRSQPLNSMLFLSFFLFSFLSTFRKQTTNEKILTQSKKKN